VEDTNRYGASCFDRPHGPWFIGAKVLPVPSHDAAICRKRRISPSYNFVLIYLCSDINAAPARHTDLSD
jgi:hypothetical protein